MCWNTKRITNLFFCLILVLSSFSVASAGISDDVANAFANGGKMFFMDLTDSFVNMTVSSSYGIDGAKGDNIGLDAIFSIATLTLNPFEMDAVLELKDIAIGVFFDVWWLLFLVLLVSALVVFVMPLDAIAQVNDIFGYDFLYAIKMAFYLLIGGIFVLMLELTFVWCVLKLNEEITSSIMMGSLNAIASTPDNWVLYCVMGIAYALLFLCFVFRAVVITMFTGLSPLIGLLVIFSPTSNMGWNLHMYFIQMVFYQMVVVLWYGCCVILASAMPQFMDAIYQIMVLLSIWLSYRFIFHLDFVRGAGLIGRIMLFKKL